MEFCDNVTFGQRTRALSTCTIAFTACFAVWTIFSIIGIRIKQELALPDTLFGILVATPILTGSLSRLALGIWTDQYGGRLVFTLIMLISAVATWMLTWVNTYYMYLLVALGIGLAGGSFAVGIAYVSTWYPRSLQGTALGIFGMGNVGAAVTNFAAPFLLIAIGWHGVAKVYAIVLFITAIVFWLSTEDDPALLYRKKTGSKPAGALKQMESLQYLQVWRFSLYYFFVFGAFVALALWLPRYYIGAFGLDIKTAGMLTFLYSMPGGVFRALGGWMSDKFGARQVMYVTLLACVLCTFILSYPSTEYTVHGIKGDISFHISIGLVPFVLLTVVLGFFMSLGKAAVYKHIPVYYPNYVGSVGGIVGLVGGLGGFILPILFGIMNDVLQIWTSCFMLLFVITAVALVWMHVSILKLDANKFPDVHKPRYLPELESGVRQNERQ